MNKKIAVIIISIIVLLSLGFAVQSIYTSSLEADASRQVVHTGTIKGSYIHNGVKREYYLYVPSELDEDSALVIAIHGYTGNAKDFMLYTSWEEVAEKNDFVVCYPQGTKESYSDQQHWNARIGLSVVDDVGFLSNLALEIADEYSLDSDRIFATGFSNGGYMSYALACERPDVFRAVAPVSALMSGQLWNSYNMDNLTADDWLGVQVNTPIPVCHIHGAQDDLIGIDATFRDDYIEKIWGGGPSAQSTVEFWADINQCSEKETIKITKNVTKQIFTNPRNDTQVWYYRIENMSHSWPTMMFDGMDIEGSHEIWDFFSMYD